MEHETKQGIIALFMARNGEFVTASKDCMAVRLAETEDEDGGGLVFEVEDYGAGARGVGKDPDTSDTLEAIKRKLTPFGCTIKWAGEGDGEVGHVEMYEVVQSPAVAFITSEHGRSAVSEAFEELTGKKFSEAFCSTHNGGKERLWPKIKRTVLNGGNTARNVSGGVSIRNILDRAGCPSL